MRVLASLLVLMLLSWCSTQAYWTSSQEPLRPRESASFERNCRLFGIVVQDISQTVSEYYHFEVIPPTALAGRALLGLYRAANVEPPEGLAREPDRYLLTQPGENLADKLQLARKVLGEHALIQGERSIHQAVHALFQTLDTFSNYAEVDTQVRNMMENGCGLGLYLEDRLQGGSYFVRHVSRNSVAHKQGIRPGDELLEINHAPIPLNTSTGRVNMLMTLNSRQRAGLHLTFRSLEGLQKKLELSAQRQQLIESNEIMLFGNDFDQETSVSGYRPLQEDNWEYWVDPVHKIALLRVGAISTSVSRFIETVDLLSLNGMKSLILDLRESPIGYPEAAASLAGLFLEKNALISTTQYRKPTHEDIQLGNNRNEIRSRHEGRRYENLPLVVLTSPETSGAAEMIASALQDHERAKIVGQRTRGKSTIQQVRGPGNTTSATGLFFSYRLTVGVFSRPSGKTLNRMPGMTTHDDWGVRPDIEVVLPAQVRRQVRAWWFENDLRPEDSREPTPLDDLRNDPVLYAAVKLLRKN